MAWWGYLLILAFVGAMGYGIVHTYNSAIEEAEKQKAANAKLTVERDDLLQKNSEQLADNMWLRMDKQRVDALLARREGERSGAARERQTLNENVERIYRENKDARDWRDQPVPVGLRLRAAERIVDKNAAGIPSGKPDR